MTGIRGPVGHALAAERDLVALDQRVREELLAHALELRPRLVAVVGRELDVDEPADAGVGDLEAEVAERALDRLALRIEDPRLRPDEHGRPHPSTTFGSAR